jgi:hypothetical protein
MSPELVVLVAVTWLETRCSALDLQPYPIGSVELSSCRIRLIRNRGQDARSWQADT